MTGNQTTEEIGTEETKAEVVKTEVSVKEQLDAVFVQHIERLFGTSYGIDGLALNLTTVPCLVLLAERETEIDSFPFVPPERYDESKLLKELSEVSLDPGEDVKKAIQDMVDKEYVEIGANEKYFAQKPTLSMSQLLDHIFPHMPGINLIAYLGQMIDEIQGGRREIGQAKIQLDQLLSRQGVPLKSNPVQSLRGNALQTLSGSDKAERAAATMQRARTQTSVWLKPADIYSHLKTDSWGLMPAATKQQPLSDSPLDPAIQPMEMDPVIPESPREKQVEPVSSTPVSDEVPPLSPPKEVETRPVESVDAGPINSPPFPGNPEPETSRSDDDIARQIEAFEDGLGLICPVCRSGQLESQSTTKGKSYYLCSNRSCNFISWGRPYYHACPQCEIPFLIETTDHTGHPILKCPRATCRFWCEYPQGESFDFPEKVLPSSPESEQAADQAKKPRRRVVRRRVVRRKR